MPEMGEKHSTNTETIINKVVKVPSFNYQHYYDKVNDMQLDCKKTSKDLQEFYDCVNKP